MAVIGKMLLRSVRQVTEKCENLQAGGSAKLYQRQKVINEDVQVIWDSVKVEGCVEWEPQW